jgi:hypothetical protein
MMLLAWRAIKAGTVIRPEIHRAANDANARQSAMAITDVPKGVGRENMEREKITAENAYEQRVRGALAVMSPGEDKQRLEDQLLAQNILHADLGHFSDPPPDYVLGEAVRDRLLAHARQDAAHALINTSRLISDVKELKRLVMMSWLTLGIFLVILLLTFWPH